MEDPNVPRFLQDDEMAVSYCFCPLNATIQEVQPTIQGFVEALRGQLEDNGVPLGVKDAQELEHASCSNDTVSFSKTVIVELATCEAGLIDDDISILEDAFVSTYNGLAMEYCDPYFRTLETAKIIEQGELTSDGNLPVKVQVTGKCRGCDPEKISIYDFPTTVISSSRRLFHNTHPSQRRLAIEACYCKADPIDNRAPSEAEFINAYHNSVSSLEGLSCVGSIGQCHFGSVFETVLYFTLANDTCGCRLRGAARVVGTGCADRFVRNNEGFFYFFLATTIISDQSLSFFRLVFVTRNKSPGTR
jgi:hypothetical protein